MRSAFLLAAALLAPALAVTVYAEEEAKEPDEFRVHDFTVLSRARTAESSVHLFPAWDFDQEFDFVYRVPRRKQEGAPVFPVEEKDDSAKVILSIVEHWAGPERTIRASAENGRVTLSGPPFLHARLSELRTALDQVAGISHEARVSFISLTPAQISARKGKPWFGLAPDAEAEALVAQAAEAKQVLFSPNNGLLSGEANVTWRPAIADYDAQVAQGAADLEPVVMLFPLGPFGVMRISRMPTGKANLVELVVRRAEAPDGWRKVQTNGRAVELVRDQAAAGAFEFLLPDGQAAVLGTVGGSKRGGFPSTIVILARSSGAAALSVDVPSTNGQVFRVTPLAGKRLSFRRSRLGLRGLRDPLNLQIQHPGRVEWTRLDEEAIGVECERMNLFARAGDSPDDRRLNATMVTPDGVVYSEFSAPEKERMRAYMTAREEAAGRQCAVNVLLVTGALPGDAVPSMTEPLAPERFSQIVELLRQGKQGGAGLIAEAGAVVRLGGAAEIETARREAYVAGQLLEVAQGATILDPNIGEASDGVALGLRLRGGGARKVRLDMSLELAEIKRIDSTKMGATLIEKPVQRFYSSERSVVLDESGAAAVPFGTWDVNGKPAPLTAIVSLFPVRP